MAPHFDASTWYTSAIAGEQAPDNAHRWHLFADWLAGADLSTAAQYKQAIQQLNIESFTAFFILRLWNGDTAWDSQDWYAARSRSGADTRWRLFVGDAGVPPDVYGRPGREARDSLIPILASLLASLQYQAYFTAQVERHLAGTLATASVRERLTALAAQLRPAMAAEAARWRPEQAPAAAVGTMGSGAATARRFAGRQVPAPTRPERPGDAAAAPPATRGPGGSSGGPAAAAGDPDCPAGGPAHGADGGRCRRRGAPEGAGRHGHRARDH